ncbi:hypothetical protein SAMN05446635_3322 [Burkholderia sp. OK233]|nr:hypothetical protein SAMN05446635_3322 [Burkholderia sp. OK233]
MEVVAIAATLKKTMKAIASTDFILRLVCVSGPSRHAVR